MTDKAKPEPLEGFQITDYDPTTEVVTIQLHRLVLKHSPEAVAKKCIQIIEHGPGVSGVQLEPRKE